MPMGIPCTAEDYFSLVDRTAKERRPGKKGTVDETLSPILERVGLSKKNWLTASTKFETEISTFVGKNQSIELACKALSKKWVNLQVHCWQVFST